MFRKSLPTAAILLCLFVVVNAVGQNLPYDSSGAANISGQLTTVGFLATFLKAPFALSVLLATLFGVVCSAFFEFWYWLFTGFGYRFPITDDIWRMGWDTVVAQWWRKPGVTWHVVVAILFWGPATLSRWSMKERRERRRERRARRRKPDLVV